MKEVKKESLSALIDGEASELEVHRLVREFRQDETLSVSWARYQHIRTTIQSSGTGGSGTGASGTQRLSPQDHESLFARISDAVEREDIHEFDKPLETKGASVKLIAGSLALAASLVVAVFIGVQQPNETTPGLVSTSPMPQNAITVQPVSNAFREAPTQELVELDEDKQRLLRNYLNQHDRMTRMNDNRHLVNYQENAGK